MSYKYQFLSKIEGKKILYIPIISMRSYEDNLYDLTCDGNVNRFISNFLDIPKDVKYECSILLPSSLSTTPESQDLIERFVKETDNKVFIINMIAYPKGGASQLRDMNGALDIFKYIQTEFESYDTIIYESNMLGALIEGVKPRYDFKTIYWCPVSKTTEINPEFLRKYEKVDLELVTKSDTTWVASANQLEYFQNYLNKNCKQKVYNINLVTNLINPRLKIFEFKTNAWILSQTDYLISEGYKLIFLPFRLTDSGYHLNTIVNDIKTVSRAFGIKICVLYSDPNDSGVLEEESKKAGDLIFKKIPKFREVYYTMLRDVDCIIPYLDDMDNILHASVFEFMHFNSKVIYLKNKFYILNKKYEISSLNEFEGTLYKALSEKKSNLFIFEGFDRIGKDSILERYKESFDAIRGPRDNEVYIQHPQNLPNYRESPEKFVAWLLDYLKEQATDLINISKWANNVLMTRLFVSDYVYGHLFNRVQVAKTVRRTLSRYFEFHNVVMLWKNFDEYVKRVDSIEEILEYDEKEFNEIQNLYLKALSIEEGTHHIIDNIDNDMSKEDIYNIVNEKIENSLWQ